MLVLELLLVKAAYPPVPAVMSTLPFPTLAAIFAPRGKTTLPVVSKCHTFCDPTKFVPTYAPSASTHNVVLASDVLSPA